MSVSRTAPASAPAVLSALIAATDRPASPPRAAAIVSGKLAPHRMVAGSMATAHRSASKPKVNNGEA